MSFTIIVGRIDSFKRSVAQKRRYYSDEPICLVINIPGGDQIVNVYLHYFLDKGLITLGYKDVSSVVVDVMQIGEKRYSYPETEFMYHRGYVLNEDDSGGWIRKINDKDMEDTLPHFLNHPYLLLKRMDKSEEELWEEFNEDVYMTPGQAKSKIL